MSGKLYGIGTGPGDPELLTLKAVSTIEMCDVIAFPSAEGNEKTAYKIVEKYLDGKQLLECSFSMEKDKAIRKECRIKVAAQVCRILSEGKNVGFITLGDPTVYSTYMYVHKLVEKQGFLTEIIPGIPSFIAAAAALNISLCEGKELLHIIPASDAKRIDDYLNLKGSKVIMKSGKNMDYVLSALDGKGFSEKTKIIERCSMEGQRIFNNIAEYKDCGGTEYFSVIVVKGE